jgi:hypothetical protein
VTTSATMSWLTSSTTNAAPLVNSDLVGFC